MKRLLPIIGFGIMLLAAGCDGAASEAVIEVLPTVAALPSVPPAALDGAGSAAVNFLENWKLGDFAAMHGLITFSSQEAIPLERFTTLYQSAQAEMTLEGLDYTSVTLYRDPTRADVAIFSYNVTFSTRLMGEFSDENRTLQLVVDARAGDWRVAWTPGDIFAELAGGGILRLEPSIPSRANIYDRNDRILADQNGRVVTVRATKQEITDWPGCLNVLAPLTGKPPEDLQRIYDESSANWLMELGVIEAAAYESSVTQLEQTCAAEFGSRPTRRYPDGTIAPNIVGAVGYPTAELMPTIEAAGFNSDLILGVSGVERNWDERLRGTPGGCLLIVNQSGQVLRELKCSTSRPPESIWLTLDTDLQTYAARVIADYYAAAGDGWAAGSNGAAAVVIDVNTGEILAMVSYPTYDANVFTPYPPMGRAAAVQAATALQSDPRRPLLNRATQGLYPLGSVMKTVSAIAVADTGVYELDQRYTCSGIWTRDIERFDWLPGGHGTLNLTGALTQSCNPYFYEVGYALNEYDPYALPDYARRLGFGVPTGLRDIAESPGLIPDPDWKRVNMSIEWSFSDAVNMSIGQGELQVTPLQVARLFAAVANGGTFYRPQLVEQVGILGEVPSYVMTPEVLSEVSIRTAVLNTVREGLCAVVQSRAGTAEFQFRDSELLTIGVCGKTGTAQNRPGAATHAWFAAYAPMNNPQVAIAVIVENGGEGSAVAAPIVRDILEYYFFGDER